MRTSSGRLERRSYVRFWRMRLRSWSSSGVRTHTLYTCYSSPQKEYDVNSLFLYIGSGKYDTFVDVFFSTGNFFFFLNLEKNVINIPNLPVFAFYRCIQKGNEEKMYFSINVIPYLVDIKDKFEDCKTELNRVLSQYEKNMHDEELELKIQTYTYYWVKLQTSRLWSLETRRSYRYLIIMSARSRPTKN
jgi:hypothetical protein